MLLITAKLKVRALLGLVYIMIYTKEILVTLKVKEVTPEPIPNSTCEIL